MTTNLGNEKVVDHLTSASAGFMRSVEVKATTKETPVRSMVERVTLEAIKKHFRPEFLNRIDETIIFKPLGINEILKIAKIQFELIKKRLEESRYKASFAKSRSGK